MFPVCVDPYSYNHRHLLLLRIAPRYKCRHRHRTLSKLSARAPRFPLPTTTANTKKFLDPAGTLPILGAPRADGLRERCAAVAWVQNAVANKLDPDTWSSTLDAPLLPILCCSATYHLRLPRAALRNRSLYASHVSSPCTSLPTRLTLPLLPAIPPLLILPARTAPLDHQLRCRKPASRRRRPSRNFHSPLRASAVWMMQDDLCPVPGLAPVGCTSAAAAPLRCGRSPTSTARPRRGAAHLDSASDRCRRVAVSSSPGRARWAALLPSPLRCAAGGRQPARPAPGGARRSSTPLPTAAAESLSLRPRAGPGGLHFCRCRSTALRAVAN